MSGEGAQAAEGLSEALAEALAEVAYNAAWAAVSGEPDPWVDANREERDGYLVMVRAVLTAQRPAAPLGDVALLDAEVAGFERGYRNAVEDFQHGGFRYGHEQAAAPVAVDEATVARVLDEHVIHINLQGAHCLGCDWKAVGWQAPDSPTLTAAHQASEVVRALAARDEDHNA